MTDLKILTVPNPILKQAAIACAEGFDAALLADKMLLWARNHNASGMKTLCVGLAAPQVGYSVRLFIMIPDPKKAKNFICINPAIVGRGKLLVKAKEGCFSAPGVSFEAERHAVIDVTYTDENGAAVKRSFWHFEARIFQHELDHLNGILCCEK